MNRKIQPGDRFGSLTVIERSEERINGYVVWLCECDCGNRLYMESRKLTRNKNISCPECTRAAGRSKDLTGMRFGKLTVIEPTRERRAGSVVWRCICDCGNEKLASAKDLTSGSVKSCGCLRTDPNRDLTGSRYGKLTVTGYAGVQNGSHTWSCKCDCGNEIEIMQSLLVSGKSKSCGCLRKDQTHNMIRPVEGTSVTRIETVRKTRIKSNSSGHTGVYLNKKSGKWIAHITFRGKFYYLGCFKTYEEAVEARCEGEKMHSEFLNWYYEKKSGPVPAVV